MTRHGTGAILTQRLVASLGLVVLYALSATAQPAQPAAASLAAKAKAAVAQFHPVSKSDVLQTKGELLAAAKQLDARLKSEGKNGEAWGQYVQLPQLLAQLQQTAATDPALLNAVYGRLSAGHEGLEHGCFVDLRNAVRKYVERAAASASPNAKTAYEELLTHLAADLETYATKPSSELAMRIGEAVRRLEGLGQAPDLVAAIRRDLVYPNVFIQVGKDVVDAGVAAPVDEIMPVRDCILGTAIYGTAHTVGKTHVALTPDSERGIIDTILHATAKSQSVGYHGPVCLDNDAITLIGLCKRIWVDASGISALPAVSNAETHTTINSITAKRKFIEKIAWKRAAKQKAQAEAIASRHAEVQANDRADAQAATTLADANEAYRKKFRNPLTERNIFPQLLRFQTTGDALHIESLQAGADQLAASGAPPALTDPSADIAVRVHESSINNAAASVLSGMILKEASVQNAARELLGKVPDRLKPDEDEEPWTIVFARQQPVSVAFADNGYSMTLRGAEYFKGEKGYPGMNVTVTYKFVKTGDEFKAVRQGELQIFPPGFVPGARQLSVREQVIRRLLERRLGKIFKPEVIAEGFVPTGKLASFGRLKPVEISAQNGWLTIGWKRAETPKKVAVR